MATKNKQKPKAGKVVRVGRELGEFLTSQKFDDETWDITLRRIIGVDELGPVTLHHAWTLPSKLVGTRSEAIGLAIEEVVKEKLPLEQKEQPIKVFSR